MATETKLTQIQLEILKWASQQGEFGFFDLYHKANLRSVHADFHQLIAHGLIADKWVGSPFASNDRYRITDAGRAALGIDTPPVAESTRLTFDWKGISEENLLQLQTVLEDIMTNDDGYAGWVAEMHFSLVADADEKEWRTAQHGE